jgi:RimJ/RimL family protein N-acetyltransferase
VTAADVLLAHQGDGITLHRTTAAVAAESFAVIDAERTRLREWLPWVDQTASVAVSQEYLAGVERASGDGSLLHATIRCAGRFAGFADLRIAAMQRSAEVGYWLAADAVGSGVMTRVVAALIDMAFGPLGLHRVQLQAATGNIRSRAIAERLGMVREGVRREAEELPAGFVDLVVYSVLEHEWPGATAVLARIPARASGPR